MTMTRLLLCTATIVALTATANAQAHIVLYDSGGIVSEYVARWKDIAAKGGEVEVLGYCGSACTLVVAYIPRERLCFGGAASLNFHQARHPDGRPSPLTTQWVISQYPNDIRNWITAPPIDSDGIWREQMPVQSSRILPAKELWKMGYKKCND
jgi:hypothetical protein